MYIWIAKGQMMLSNNNDANTQKNMWHKIFAPHIINIKIRSYPPKSSKRIISSSTPRLCKRSSTVLDIIGGPQR